MPEQKTVARARRDARAGKSPSTQAGEFVREEMHHIREGKHGARSAKQAVAIGLSKARSAGVDLAPPKRASKKTRASAASATKRGRSGAKRTSTTRSRATSKALKREGQSAASPRSLSRQATAAAKRRPASARSAAARKAARTKGAAGRSAAARKGARTRARARARA